MEANDTTSMLSPGDLLSPSDGAIPGAARLKQDAERVRKEWVRWIGLGERPLDSLWKMARDDGSPEGRYVCKIKLFDILRLRPGWRSADRAFGAMRERGMTPKTNVMQALRYQGVMNAFTTLYYTHGDEWVPEQEEKVVRPQMPEGWPWRGKLDFLLTLDGAEDYIAPPHPLASTQYVSQEGSQAPPGGALEAAPMHVHTPAEESASEAGIIRPEPEEKTSSYDELLDDLSSQGREGDVGYDDLNRALIELLG